MKSATDGSSATFVIPHYSDHPRFRQHLERTIAGLFAQTDTRWFAIIVDDASPRAEDRDWLVDLGRRHPDRFSIVLQDENHGAGVCRNLGVRQAWEMNSDLVLFNDADDVSHPQRLEVVRRILATQPEVDFVYSTFSIIDEHDAPVPRSRLIPMIAEILESHDAAPVEGPGAWIRIGTETGYTTLTSTVAVRTSLAMAHPFPADRGSEDSHAWFRMSAGGRRFAYAPSIPTLYRIPQFLQGSSNYTRVGAHVYHAQKIDVETDGFSRAIAIALERGAIDETQVPPLRARFFHRLAQTMSKEGQHELVRLLVEKEAAALQQAAAGG